MNRSESQQLYGSAEPQPSDGGRLLLLSRHFAPATSAGALRWQKLAGLAAARGVALDVVTEDPSALAAADPERLKDLPASTRVYGVRGRTHPVERAERTLRAWLRGPPDAGASPAPAHPGPPGADPVPPAPGAAARAYDTWLHYASERDWARRATAVARGLAHGHTHRAIVTCGPPHMVHGLGNRLARSLSLPHVVDMRDPWRLVERVPEHLSRDVYSRLARGPERRAIRGAAFATMNTPAAQAAMQSAYPAHAEKILCVMNGYDEEPLPVPTVSARFVIAHLGTIYLDRDPTALFRAAGRVVRELGLGPDALGVEFMGEASDVRGVSTADLAAREGLGEHFQLHATAPRARAMTFLAGASLLVNLAQDSHLAIPSKIFEYLRFPAWVLALAAPGSATEQVLRDTRAIVARPDDVEGIAAAIRRCVLAHRAGKRPTPVAEGSGLSRRAQADRLLDALDRLAPWPRR